MRGILPLNIELYDADCERRAFVKAERKIITAKWVDGLKPWQVIAHLTFPWEASEDSTRRVYERFMRKSEPGVSYFYAVEENPGRRGHHVHALWHSNKEIFRKGVWSEWFNKYGRAKIEVINSHEDVANYCSKYCTKKDGWWNVNLIGGANNVPRVVEPGDFALA